MQRAVKPRLIPHFPPGNLGQLNLAFPTQVRRSALEHQSRIGWERLRRRAASPALAPVGKPPRKAETLPRHSVAQPRGHENPTKYHEKEAMILDAKKPWITRRSAQYPLADLLRSSQEAPVGIL